MNKKTILVIDDDAIVLKSCKRILESEDYSVTLCPSATDGMNILKNSAFSLIIIDILMPCCNGLNLSEKIEKEYPGTKFLIISGYMEPKPFSEIIIEKKMNFLPKPFTPDELLKAVKFAIIKNPESTGKNNKTSKGDIDE